MGRDALNKMKIFVEHLGEMKVKITLFTISVIYTERDN